MKEKKSKTRVEKHFKNTIKFICIYFKMAQKEEVDTVVDHGVGEVVPIELWDSQTDHFNRVIGILKRWHAYMDTSETGCGKTVVTLALCAVLQLSLVVVGPLCTLTMWEREARKYGVRLIYSMSYQKLGGTSKNGCSHPFIDRKGDSFMPTQYLRDVIESRTLFVFDESHNLKNPGTAQLSAAHAIVRTIVQANQGSRIALLSGTPSNEKVHAQSLLRMLGVIRDTKLYEYNKSTREYTSLGIDELIVHCDALDRQTSRMIHQPVTLSNRTANDLCYDLFLGVVKPVLASSMPKPEIAAIKDVRNGYYDMPPEDIEDLRIAEAALRRATRYRADTGTVEIRTGSWGDITTALVALEKSKLSTLVRLAKEKLEANPNYKVILYVWYLDSMRYLEKALEKYLPLIMNGETKTKERDNIVDLFQQDTTTARLIISNAKVGGIGISLDDRSGTKPRFVFMIPSYNIIEAEQTTGRTHRGTTRSDATIRFVYGKGFAGETSIHNALSRKSEVMKSMLFNDKNVVFPGDYDLYIEGEGNKLNPKKLEAGAAVQQTGHRLGTAADAGIDDLETYRNQHLNI